MMIHTQLLKKEALVPVTYKFFICPIMASLLIFPLFPFSINIIAPKDDSFGHEESGFKRKLLFGLLALQFIPLMLSIGFMVTTEVPADKSGNLLVEQLVANFLFLTAALILKFGNYLRSDSDGY